MTAAAAPGSQGRVLVTGARGFTGPPLVRALENAGYAVVPAVLEEPGAGEVAFDLASPASCDALVRDVAPDYVIHLAAISFVQHEDAGDFYRVNTVGTVHLLEALVRAGKPLRKVVLASSANVYGQVDDGVPIVETRRPAPANHYAASKLAMEVMAANWFDRLPIVVTRPFNYTGVGQTVSFLVPKIVSHFARGDRTIELGNVDVERDFSDVRMVADVYRRLLACDARGTALNICTGRAISLAAVIEAMERIAGYRIEVRVNPAFVRANDIRRLTGDPSALVAAIGPVDVIPFDDTLEGMFIAMKAVDSSTSIPS